MHTRRLTKTIQKIILYYLLFIMLQFTRVLFEGNQHAKKEYRTKLRALCACWYEILHHFLTSFEICFSADTLE